MQNLYLVYFENKQYFSLSDLFKTQDKDQISIQHLYGYSAEMVTGVSTDTVSDDTVGNICISRTSKTPALLFNKSGNNTLFMRGTRGNETIIGVFNERPMESLLPSGDDLRDLDVVTDKYVTSVENLLDMLSGTKKHSIVNFLKTVDPSTPIIVFNK